jgi:hypothetical protein
MKKASVFCTPICALVFLLISCTTSDKPLLEPAVLPSVRLSGRPIKTADQLADFFMDANRDFPDERYVKRLAEAYVRESALEGINSDAAFAQMCLETGFLRFGGLVTPEMNNFCGLGAIDSQHPGERFPTVEVGVRAHVQHLHAYGTTGDLRQPLVDMRYKYVQPRGKAPDIYALTGTWAADPEYGRKLERILHQMSKY